MQFFRNIRIKRKMILVIVASSMATLLLASATTFVFQWIHGRLMLQSDLTSLSEIIAANSTAAMTFGDEKAAAEMLASLKNKPHVVSACLYRNDRTLLAHMGAERDRHDLPQGKPPQGFRFEGPYLLLYQPVILDYKRIGTLFLRFDFQAMQSEMTKPYLAILGFTLPASLLLALVLSSVLQRFVSVPILDLASTARAVAEHKDYSVRARAHGRDEVGSLTSAFNLMLSRIHEQDVALRAASERYHRQHQALTVLTRGELLHDDLETALRQLCETDARTLGVARVSIWRFNEERTAIQCVSLHAPATAPDSLGQILEAGRYPAYFLVLAGTDVLAAQHVLSDPRTSELADDYLQPLGITSMMDTPINLNGEMIGVLCHEHVGMPREWMPDEETFALAMANLVSMAFGHWERKQTQAKLAELNRQLLDTSRMAGMAEVATGVLHNVGNVLNSVNVSCTLAIDRLGQSKVANLSKVSAMLERQNGRMVEFLAEDPKGRQIPGYLCSLAPVLVEEQSAILKELHALRDRIDHIKEIVAMQQSYARISGVVETISVAQLVEDAIKLNAGTLARHGVEVVREFSPLPAVSVDKHKVLQILLNLIRNAKYACDDGRADPKLITLRISSPRAGWFQIQVADNGVGIAPENLTRVFAHGFTTRKEGHGFGLHSGALAARELGGTLQAASPGPNQGAVFTLELPIQPPRIT